MKVEFAAFSQKMVTSKQLRLASLKKNFDCFCKQKSIISNLQSEFCKKCVIRFNYSSKHKINKS